MTEEQKKIRFLLFIHYPVCTYRTKKNQTLSIYYSRFRKMFEKRQKLNLNKNDSKKKHLSGGWYGSSVSGTTSSSDDQSPGRPQPSGFANEEVKN